MKALNQLISDYTACLRQGELQLAYREILAFLGKLRAGFIKRYPQYGISGVYQGYMDMSCFSLSAKSFRDRDLRGDIVYPRAKGCFDRTIRQGGIGRWP